MGYTAGKTDWAPPDVVQSTDLNEIGNNLVVARRGGGESSIPTVSVDNVGRMDIDMVHNCFHLTSKSFPLLNWIQYTDGTTSREDSNIITIISNIGISLATGVSTTGNYAALQMPGTPVPIVQYDVVQFVFYNNLWYHIAIA